MTARLNLVQLMIIATEITGIIQAWHLEARPSLKYTTLGGSPTITCYNITSTATLPHNTRWYKNTFNNGTLQQLPTDVNERVRSDSSQLRISYARNDDNGTYCCKGPTQALDTCDETATAHLVVVVPPVIAPGQNQTVDNGKKAVMECVIEDIGNPSFSVARWQKSEQRLITDGIKYSSQLVGNRMFLTIINSTTDDEGYYQCILETPVFQRSEASVYLSMNQTSTELTDAYTLQILGQREISIGQALTIQCKVMGIEESSRPVDASDIHMYLILPTGEVIIGREFNTVATLENNGTYSCIAFVNGNTSVATHSVTVCAAPQPSYYSDTITALYGSNVTLPCTIDVANPPPSYKWEQVSVEDESAEINQTLSDGSLLLKNVQTSGMYQCTADNGFGRSIQMIKLSIKEFTIMKHQSLELVGTHLQSSCDQAEHKIIIASQIEEYITSICNCGEIIIDIIVTSCNTKRVVYNIKLNGIMATEAALLLVTKMQNLTEGLDLGIVVLFLQEPDDNLESQCDDQTPSGVFSIIVILIITTIVISVTLFSVQYFRKRITRYSSLTQNYNEEAITNPSYDIPPPYSRLQNFNIVPVTAIRRCNSENSLTSCTQSQKPESCFQSQVDPTNATHISYGSKSNDDD